MNRNSQQTPLTSLLNYQLYRKECLGKGYNSHVYKALNTRTRQLVSIKEINLVHAQRHMIANQSQCLRNINHPHVLSFRQSFINVTELCQQTLHDRIKRMGKFEQEQALRIFIDLLDGYQQVRKAGFLHRDLKPDNIFFKGNKAKIGDFGFCLRLRCEQIKDRMNIGSPLYMAPQALQYNIYSQKSDVWSLGLILYQMLHGKSPFISKTEQALIEQLKRPIHNYDCHPRIIKIFKQIFSYHRQQRLSAQQLANLLQEHLSQQKGSADRSQDEMNYLKLMEYIKTISNHFKNNINIERISYLFEFNIRMRINFLSSQQFINKQRLNQFVKRHSFTLQTPNLLTTEDRLHFFPLHSTCFDISLLWQTQAELKDIIRHLLSSLYEINCEQMVIRRQQEIRLADFLLTAFILNRNLIQSDYTSQSCYDIATILRSPQCFTLCLQTTHSKGQVIQNYLMLHTL